MSTSELQPLTLELRQTREFTTREKRQMLRIWRKLLWRGGTSFWYNVWSHLWIGFGAFLALSILMAANRLEPTAPNLAAQLIVAGIGFATAVIFSQWMTTRLYENRYWSGQRLGDRFTIESDGLTAASAHGSYHCPWAAIDAISNGETLLVLALPRRGALLLAKSAFADQDVAGFCAELERRWREGRTQSA